jgi:hypothetical protein
MRVPIPSDRPAKILDTNGRAVGLLIQNLSATDVYTTDTEGFLKDVDPVSGAPSQGAKWGNGMVQPQVIPRFIGIWYGRAPAPTSLEITIFEVECSC